MILKNVNLQNKEQQEELKGDKNYKETKKKIFPKKENKNLQYLQLLVISLKLEQEA